MKRSSTSSCGARTLNNVDNKTICKKCESESIVRKRERNITTLFGGKQEIMGGLFVLYPEMEI